MRRRQPPGPQAAARRHAPGRRAARRGRLRAGRLGRGAWSCARPASRAARARPASSSTARTRAPTRSQRLGLPLAAGDQVSAVLQRWVGVSGAVERPGQYAFSETLTLRALVEPGEAAAHGIGSRDPAPRRRRAGGRSRRRSRRARAGRRARSPATRCSSRHDGCDPQPHSPAGRPTPTAARRATSRSATTPSCCGGAGSCSRPRRSAASRSGCSRASCRCRATRRARCCR